MQQDPDGEIEFCAICDGPTVLWTDLPDRSPGAQVAICHICAEAKAPADVPTKRAWFDRVMPRFLSPQAWIHAIWDGRRRRA